MYCISCGGAQPSDATFCPYCGKKQPADSDSQSRVAPIIEARPAFQVLNAPASASPNVDFPIAGDLEPIAFYEKREWMFRYKSAANPPPTWTKSTVDLMFSEDYVVLQSNTDVATLKDKLKEAGSLALLITAGAAPVIGAGMVAALALGKTIPRAKKHIGYGKNNQFTREAILHRFLVGEAIWAKKSECEFRDLTSRLLLSAFTFRYFVVIAKFHHISGFLDYAAFNCLSGTHDFIDRCGCTFTRKEKFRVCSEAVRSLVEYPEPPITKDQDDTYL